MKAHRHDVALSHRAPMVQPPSPPSNDTQQLANELLEHIFSHCTPVQLTVVSRVCRRWRDVAYDCPRLWTHVEPDNMSWSADFLHTVLRRSKGLPISVIMSLPQPSPDLGFSLVYLSIIAPTLHRMQRLEMRLASREDANELLYVLQGRAPMLRVLRLLSFDGQTPSDELVLPSNLLAEDPGVLEELTLAWNFSSSTPIPQAFRNVKHLQLFSNTLTSAMLGAILHTCSKLVFLEVNVQEYVSELEDGSVSHLEHNLHELLIYHPIKHAVLLDLGHEGIPAVGLTSDCDTLTELQSLDRTDAKSLSWPVLSEHWFDTLSMRWNFEGILPRLFLQYVATADNLRRYSYIDCICAMDVLSGRRPLDFSCLTSATIEDGCWPESAALFAPALQSLTIRLTNRPPDLRRVKIPSCLGDWTIFGDHSNGSPAHLRLSQFPKLQTLSVENKCSQASMLTIAAGHLLNFVDPRRAERRIAKLQLGGGVLLQGSSDEISALKNRFVAIVPQVQVNVTVRA